MWKEIAALRSSSGLHDEKVDHDREVETMRDDRLPDGCAVQDFSAKVNRLIRDHAPHMDRPFASDARMAEFIIRLMPEANASEGRSLLRRLADARDLTSSRAIHECTVIVRESQKMENRRVLSAAAALRYSMSQERKTAPAAVLHASSPPAVAPAPAQPQVASRPMYFANAKSLVKADKAASAAVAAARATWAKGTKVTSGPGSGKKLPDDKWCWEGTCHYDHAPTERCFRAPWFKGDETIPNPGPDHAWTKVRSDASRIARLNKDKDDNARRLGTEVFKLKVAPPKNASGSAAVPQAPPNPPAEAAATKSMDGLDAFQLQPGGVAATVLDYVSSQFCEPCTTDQFSDTASSSDGSDGANCCTQFSESDSEADSESSVKSVPTVEFIGVAASLASQKDMETYFAQQQAAQQTEHDNSPVPMGSADAEPLVLTGTPVRGVWSYSPVK